MSDLQVKNCMLCLKPFNSNTGDMNEDRIMNAINSLSDVIDGWGYILHDKDTHTQNDVDRYNRFIARMKKKHSDYVERPFPYAIGSPVDPHWHIVLSARYGNDGKQIPISVSRIAEAFGVPENMIGISCVSGWTAMPAMLAYLIHDPRLGDSAAGKHRYDLSEVKTNMKGANGLIDRYFTDRPSARNW